MSGEEHFRLIVGCSLELDFESGATLGTVNVGLDGSVLKAGNDLEVLAILKVEDEDCRHGRGGERERGKSLHRIVGKINNSLFQAVAIVLSRFSTGACTSEEAEEGFTF